MKRDTILTIRLPSEKGLQEYAVREPRQFTKPSKPFTRKALAAAHVVADAPARHLVERPTDRLVDGIGGGVVGRTGAGVEEELEEDRLRELGGLTEAAVGAVEDLEEGGDGVGDLLLPQGRWRGLSCKVLADGAGEFFALLLDGVLLLAVGLRE